MLKLNGMWFNGMWFSNTYDVINKQLCGFLKELMVLMSKPSG